MANQLTGNNIYIEKFNTLFPNGYNRTIGGSHATLFNKWNVQHLGTSKPIVQYKEIGKFLKEIGKFDSAVSAERHIFCGPKTMPRLVHFLRTIHADGFVIPLDMINQLYKTNMAET